MLDLLFGIDPDARVFALDTHVLFPETYAVWREVERRYGARIEVYEGPTLARQAELHGQALWERQPDLCCAIRKVEPLGRALGDLDAWITGLRRDRSPTRADAPKVGWDATHELLEGKPARRLGRRTLLRLPARARSPYNELHDSGYASIGCTHCTQPGAGRAGRWEGSAKSECGLHTDSAVAAGAASEETRTVADHRA